MGDGVRTGTSAASDGAGERAAHVRDSVADGCSEVLVGGSEGRGGNECQWEEWEWEWEW